MGDAMTVQASVVDADRPVAASDSQVVDLQRFMATPLVREPFPYLIVPGFVPPAMAEAAAATFSAPDMAGVLPAPAVTPDSAFGVLLDALRGPCVTTAFSAKFGLPLTQESLMVTLRSRTRPADGRIHTDSETKKVTALIYLNTAWDAPGGRLRLLRGPDDIEDMIAEAPPLAGTLLAFQRTDCSWHGHQPFDGVRRSIMLNWMTDAATARWELHRHAVTAAIKRIFAK